MNLTPRLLALGLAALTLAPAATAGDWGLKFGQRTRNGHVSVTAGSRGFSVDLTRGRQARGHVHGASCRHVPGHYRVVRERVWVPGCREKVWVPARYDYYYDDCGNRIERQIAPAHWEWIETPGRYEYRDRQVWVRARYACNHGPGITTYPRYGRHGRR